MANHKHESSEISQSPKCPTTTKPNLTKKEMESLLDYYRSRIDAMQGHVFYCQDPDGVLRRWYPPKRWITDLPNDIYGEEM